MVKISKPKSATDKNNELYVAEKIVDKREIDGMEEYRVKWEGYSMKECTWEPKEHLINTTLISDYERIQKKANKVIFSSTPRTTSYRRDIQDAIMALSANKEPEFRISRLMESQDNNKKYAAKDIYGICGVLHKRGAIVYSTILKNNKLVFLTADQVPKECHYMIVDMIPYVSCCAKQL
uniref:Chromo domain-containing protein n=1 Tax=Rhabditophanes sp. KR3021 TaxID=114890 RepID=A0AC35TRS2_9BILA